MTNQAQHTPGPWRSGLYEISESCLKIQIEPVDSSKLAVAYAWGVDHEETRANAHLIAAAPEMLKALKGFMALGVSHYKTGFSETDKELDALFDEGARICDAIAKAEGRA